MKDLVQKFKILVFIDHSSCSFNNNNNNNNNNNSNNNDNNNNDNNNTFPFLIASNKCWLCFV